MKCLSCDSLSFQIICKTCQNNLLKPSLFKREIEKDFYVYSFYSFSELEDLINSKYEFYGDLVYEILAKKSFEVFAKDFKFNEKIYSLSIDDHTRHEFSQTAILNKHLNSKNIKPIYKNLLASNIVKYAGKDLEFRQKNKRDFKGLKLKNKKLILVDDLITSGTTIKEAKEYCEKANNEVLFALTLADAKY